MIEWKDKIYKIDDPIFDRDGKLVGNETTFYTVEEIIKEYFPYWKSEMISKFGEEYFTMKFGDSGEEICVEDWIIINYAVEAVEEDI